MKEPLPGCLRRQSLGEEIANSISHGMGLLIALVFTPVLIITAARQGGVTASIGSAVFALTLVLLYLASTLYHALPYNKAKRLFQVFDHCAIFLLIAGTYTPFTLGVLRGAWGWVLLVLVWGLAVVGVGAKAIGGIRYPLLSTCLYIMMGWLVLVAIRPVWLRVPPEGIGWLVAGGIAYTGGVGFFAAEQRRYSHFVWHLFVLAGSLCHMWAVLWYAI